MLEIHGLMNFGLKNCKKKFKKYLVGIKKAYNFALAFENEASEH